MNDARDAARLRVRDLGDISYDDAYLMQTAAVDEVLAWRAEGSPQLGQVLCLEHRPPVITVSRRASAAANLLAPPQLLESMGIQVRETDRGGDITYHGPGQLVLYVMLDLQRLSLTLHAYMRLLEQAVIDTCAEYSIAAARDATATGVWVGDAKICAMGVRVRKWVTMHGLAINITTDLSHFDAIIPCGLAGRRVTSLERLMGEPAVPSLPAVRARLISHLLRCVNAVPLRNPGTPAA